MSTDSDLRHLRPDVAGRARTDGESHAPSAAVVWRPLISPGMAVVGVAGDELGRVAEVRPDDLVIDRSGSLGLTPSSPLALPYDRIHAIIAGHITLDIPSSQVEEYATPRADSPI